MTQALADETVPAEQTPQEFLADVLAGFAEDDEGSSAPTTTPEKEPEASAHPDESAALPEETPSDPVAPPDELLTRISTLEANHKKYSDDVAGRVGMLESVIKAQARTPVGQKVQVKIEDFGEFGEEYPEFAKAQAKVINQVIGQLEVTGISPDFIDTLKRDASSVAEAIADAKLTRRQVVACREELDETHEGWRDLIGLPDKDIAEGGVPPDTEYRRWLATQPKDYAQRVTESYSSVVIGRSIDKFQAWKAAQTAKPKATVPTRQQRLTAAVPARTSSTTPAPKREQTVREAILEGFNSDD